MNSINFCSFARSGHHAIIFWILNNLCDGFTEQSNNLYYINKDSGIYYYNDISAVERSSKYVYPQQYRHLFKSYEDIPIDSEYSFLYESENTIFIVRDFLNLLCSRYTRCIGYRRVLGHREEFKYFVDLIKAWKIHARLYLDTPKRCILYNKWLVDKQYRNTVSKNINIPNIKDNCDFVPSIGNGSSFIQGNKESSDQNYMHRYTQTDLPITMTIPILQDHELYELNRDIFGIDIRQILTSKR